MRYSEITQPLNEGAIKDVLVKIKNILSKTKSVIAPLAKYNFNKFVSNNKPTVQEVSDRLLKQILAGQQLTVDDVKAALKPIAMNAAATQKLGESVELTEDIASIAGKMFSQLGGIFLSFMAILQSDFVIQNYKNMKTSPSMANDLMMKGSSLCLFYILIGITMTIALSVYYHQRGKERDADEDESLARRGLTKHY